MPDEKPRLSDLEHEVMAVLWLRPECPAQQVRDALKRDPPLKEATVRTILRRLETKGYVTRRTEGRTYIYRPAVAAAEAATSAIRRIIGRYCQGSVERLLVGLLEDEVVSPEQLREILRKATQDRKGE